MTYIYITYPKRYPHDLSMYCGLVLHCSFPFFIVYKSFWDGLNHSFGMYNSHETSTSRFCMYISYAPSHTLQQTNMGHGKSMKIDRL